MRTPLEVVGENARQRVARPQQDQDEEVRVWRESWLNQLKSSRFYLDGIEPAAFEATRAQLAALGVSFEMFFELGSVTHVITRRSLDREYPVHDVLTSARRHGRIKVWTTEKLERFLKSLLGRAHDKVAAAAAERDNAKLEQLLQIERLTGGPPDKDQWHRFDQNYLLVWDPTNRHRPVAHKEWSVNPPQLHLDNVEGVCPFIACRAPKRRATWNDEPAKRLCNKENNVGTLFIGGRGREQEQEHERDREPDAENPEAPAAPAAREQSVRTRRYGEIAASGVQRNSATSALVSNVPRFQAPSRDFQALAKKEQPVKPKKSRKPRKGPGMCENCFAKFDSLEEHIQTAKHRRYASDDKNFDELDATIRLLQRPEDVSLASSQATDV